MVSSQGKNNNGRTGMPTIPHESSGDDEILTDDIDQVFSDGEATVEMIHDFVERLPHGDQWYDDSFDDGSLLMQGVTGHAVRRTQQVGVEQEAKLEEPVDDEPIAGSPPNGGQRRTMHAHEYYDHMDSDSWTEEEIEEEEEEEEQQEEEDDDIEKKHQYQTLLPEFDTSAQNESRLSTIESTKVIVIEDLSGQPDPEQYDDSHHLVLDENQSRSTEGSDDVDEMTRENGNPNGQIIRDTTMIQHNSSIAETSSDEESDDPVQENEYHNDDDSETCPDEDDEHYEEIISMDLNHGESIMFVEEEVQDIGIQYECQSYTSGHTIIFSQSASETGPEEEASVLGERTEDHEGFSKDQEVHFQNLIVSDGDSMTEVTLNENGILGAQKREGVTMLHDDSDDDVPHSHQYKSDKDGEEMEETFRESHAFSGRISYETNSTEEYVIEPGAIPLYENEENSPLVDETMSLDDVFVRGTMRDIYTDSANQYTGSVCSNSLYDKETTGNCSDAPIDAESYISAGEGDPFALLATPEPLKRIGYRRPLTLEDLAGNSRMNGPVHNLTEEDDSFATDFEEEVDNACLVLEPTKRIEYHRTSEDSHQVVTESAMMRRDPTSNPHLIVESRQLDEDQGSVINPILVEEMVQAGHSGDDQQDSSVSISEISPSGSVEQTAQKAVISKAKELEACIEAFGYYLDQRQNPTIIEDEYGDLLKAALEPPSERSGIYRAVPWKEDPDAEGQILIRREDISRVPSSLLGEFSQEDGMIRSVAFDKIRSPESSSSKSESASVYTDPDKDIPTPLTPRANATDRLGTSLEVPMGMDGREEENELEYSIIAESLGMDGVEDAMAESGPVANDDKTRKSVRWDEFAQVKSDDPFLKSGPVKLSNDTNGRLFRRNKKNDTKKASGCSRLCDVFHEAPYWTKVLVYVSITLLCIALGIILTAITSGNSSSSVSASVLRFTLPPTPTPTAAPTMAYDLVPPQNVTIVDANVTTASPSGMENATMAPSELSNIISDLVNATSTSTTSAPPTISSAAAADDEEVEEPTVPTTTTTTVSTPATTTTTTTAATTVSTPAASPATNTNRPPFLWGK